MPPAVPFRNHLRVCKAAVVAQDNDWLHCPDCHFRLRSTTDSSCCDRCGGAWAVVNGIADFSNSRARAEQTAFGAYAAALSELVRVAAEAGWFEALAKVIRPLPVVGPGIFSYVTDESKGDLVHVMNTAPGMKILDLGCGLGAVSVALAQRGVDCYAADISHEHVTFTTIRCHQLEFANVRVVCAGDDMKLPLQDNYLDAVIMNGVFEWLGCSGRYDGSPEQAQAAMLREVYRILRPGGQLYVASKNRYALLHLLGAAPDHGARLRWLGMLPFRLQRILTLGRAVDSGARVYGLNGFRRLFRDAEFAEEAVYAVMPQFRHPKRFIPLAQM